MDSGYIAFAVAPFSSTMDSGCITAVPTIQITSPKWTLGTSPSRSLLFRPKWTLDASPPSLLFKYLAQNGLWVHRLRGRSFLVQNGLWMHRRRPYYSIISSPKWTMGTSPPSLLRGRSFLVQNGLWMHRRRLSYSIRSFPILSSGRPFRPTWNLGASPPSLLFNHLLSSGRPSYPIISFSFIQSIWVHRRHPSYPDHLDYQTSNLLVKRS